MKNFSVTILGHKVPVRFVDKLPASKGHVTYGDFEANPLEIRILRDQPYPKKTILHEICHAWLCLSGLSNQLESDGLEENICSSFENTFAPMLEKLLK